MGNDDVSKGSLGEEREQEAQPRHKGMTRREFIRKAGQAAGLALVHFTILGGLAGPASAGCEEYDNCTCSPDEVQTDKCTGNEEPGKPQRDYCMCSGDTGLEDMCSCAAECSSDYCGCGEDPGLADACSCPPETAPADHCSGMAGSSADLCVCNADPGACDICTCTLPAQDVTGTADTCSDTDASAGRPPADVCLCGGEANGSTDMCSCGKDTTAADYCACSTESDGADKCSCEDDTAQEPADYCNCPADEQYSADVCVSSCYLTDAGGAADECACPPEGEPADSCKCLHDTGTADTCTDCDHDVGVKDNCACCPDPAVADICQCPAERGSYCEHEQGGTGHPAMADWCGADAPGSTGDVCSCTSGDANTATNGDCTAADYCTNNDVTQDACTCGSDQPASTEMWNTDSCTGYCADSAGASDVCTCGTDECDFNSSSDICNPEPGTEDKPSIAADCCDPGANASCDYCCAQQDQGDVCDPGGGATCDYCCAQQDQGDV